MILLNQDLQYSQLSNDVKNAFRGIPTKALLEKGTSLHRFSGHSGISPWWSETKELSNVLLNAKASGKGLFKYIRSRTAVLRSWDTDMFNLIVAKLNQPVYAFRGTIAAQNEASKFMNPNDLQNYKKRFTKPIFFGGGNGQVYINGLNSSHISFEVPVGAVNVYDDIEEVIGFLAGYRVI